MNATRAAATLIRPVAGVTFLVAADGTVRDMSAVPSDAEPEYLFLAAPLHPVIDASTLAATHADIDVCTRALDRHADPVTRGYLRSELADLYREAAGIRHALTVAADLADA